MPSRSYSHSSRLLQFNRLSLAVALAACRRQSSLVGPRPLHPAVYPLTRSGLVRRPLASFLGLCRRSLNAAAFHGAFRVALVRTRPLGLGFADLP